MRSNFVEHFCTPHPSPITESELKAISSGKKFTVPFEDEMLNCYCWGEGKTVLLVHGWSSRASHMVLMAKYLSGFGYRVVAFDAPAHFSIVNNEGKRSSNMFEFGKAVSTVAKYLGDVYAVIGHSLGTAAAVFASTGFSKLADYKFDTAKLILISSPSSVESILRNFCKRNGLDEDDFHELWRGLEAGFDMKIEEYSMGEAVKTCNSSVFLIHDKDDEEFSLNEAFQICSASNSSRLFVTSKNGHYRILLNRSVLNEIKNYLTCF